MLLPICKILLLHCIFCQCQVNQACWNSGGKRSRKNALTVEIEVWIFTTTRYLLQSIFAEFNHIKNRYQRVDVHIRPLWWGFTPTGNLLKSNFKTEHCAHNIYYNWPVLNRDGTVALELVLQILLEGNNWSSDKASITNHSCHTSSHAHNAQDRLL